MQNHEQNSHKPPLTINQDQEQNPQHHQDPPRIQEAYHEHKIIDDTIGHEKSSVLELKMHKTDKNMKNETNKQNQEQNPQHHHDHPRIQDAYHDPKMRDENFQHDNLFLQPLNMLKPENIMKNKSSELRQTSLNPTSHRG